MSWGGRRPINQKELKPTTDEKRSFCLLLPVAGIREKSSSLVFLKREKEDVVLRAKAFFRVRQIPQLFSLQKNPGGKQVGPGKSHKPSVVYPNTKFLANFHQNLPFLWFYPSLFQSPHLSECPLFRSWRNFYSPTSFPPRPKSCLLYVCVCGPPILKGVPPSPSNPSLQCQWTVIGRISQFPINESSFDHVHMH